MQWFFWICVHTAYPYFLGVTGQIQNKMTTKTKSLRFKSRPSKIRNLSLSQWLEESQTLIFSIRTCHFLNVTAFLKLSSTVTSGKQKSGVPQFQGVPGARSSMVFEPRTAKGSSRSKLATGREWGLEDEYPGYGDDMFIKTYEIHKSRDEEWWITIGCIWITSVVLGFGIRSGPMLDEMQGAVARHGPGEDETWESCFFFWGG